MKPIIKKIEFSKEELDEIDKINKGQAVPKVRTLTSKNGSEYDVTYNKKFSFHLGRKRLLELYGGHCILCAKYPDYKVSYYVGSKEQ
jgi:hypothetical protein